uniref:Homing endonuclease n=1 Tax=Acetithermum autotrophicum TaxID=1446466 RepID=H5SRB8_ACEAU|nr:homing endonuclease [Candidatus Acetothermum autotrophicum]
MGGANQQERLSAAETKKWFLAGFIEGEGSLCVSIKEHPSARFGYYVDPEFFIYQHKSGFALLKMAQEIFGTGQITPKPGNEEVLVFSITSRRSLKEKVIPFFEKYMIYSAKREIFERFKEIVEAMEDRKEHLTPEGLARIVEKAYAMNPASKGKERKRSLQEVVGRILRGRTPDTPVG